MQTYLFKVLYKTKNIDWKNCKIMIVGNNILTITSKYYKVESNKTFVTS